MEVGLTDQRGEMSLMEKLRRRKLRNYLWLDRRIQLNVALAFAVSAAASGACFIFAFRQPKGTGVGHDHPVDVNDRDGTYQTDQPRNTEEVEAQPQVRRRRALNTKNSA